MSRLTTGELLLYSKCVDALRDKDTCYERMSEISKTFLRFKYNTDEVGVYFLDGEIIVAANGSNTFREWIDNLRIFKTKEGFHRGFYETAQGVFCELMKIKKFNDELYKKVTFTGHSRGGYILITNAMFNGLDSKKRDTKCVTFGSPRMGNRKAMRLLEALGVINHRVGAEKDPVDNLSPSILGYKHFTTELYEIGDKKFAIDHLSYSKILQEELECVKKMKHK